MYLKMILYFFTSPYPDLFFLYISSFPTILQGNFSKESFLFPGNLGSQQAWLVKGYHRISIKKVEVNWYKWDTDTMHMQLSNSQARISFRVVVSMAKRV